MAVRALIQALAFHVVALVTLIGTPRSAFALPPNFLDETLPISFDQAVGVTFHDSGRAYVWEKGGQVWTVDGGVKSSQPLVDITEEVRNFRDYGLLGFALDPNYDINHYIYLLYVVDWYYLEFLNDPDYNPAASLTSFDSIGRITRYTADATTNYTTVVPGSRTILVGETITTGIPVVNESHGVGTILFAEDGSMIVTTGDAASFVIQDAGGDVPGTIYNFMADGICQPKEDVGAYRSQLVDSLCGKILRLDPATGDGLPDNPFYDAAQPRAPRSRVWAMGLRNPYRLVLVPGTGHNHPGDNFPGVMIAGDVGWNDWEELNVCTAAAQNFGWPIYEGFDLQPLYNDGSAIAFNVDAPNPLASPPTCDAYFNFQALLAPDTQTAPVWANPCNVLEVVPASIPRHKHRRAAIMWSHDFGAYVPTYDVSGQPTASRLGTPGCPTTGTDFFGYAAGAGAWYHGENFPEEYHDTLFIMDYAANWIRNVVFDANYNITEVREFENAMGPVSMAVNPVDGTMYYVSFNFEGVSELHRISYGGDGLPVVQASATPNFGPLPLNVQFSTAGTFDPESQPLTYLWDFGDGSPTSTNPNPSHTYAGAPGAPTTFTASVTVTDTASNAVTKMVKVFGNNTPPSVTITSPLDGSFYTMRFPEVTVPLTANVSDAETPEQTTCSWQLILHHNTHTHPDPPMLGCSQSATFTPIGCEPETYFYEFRLTVTDAQGLSTTAISTMSASCCPADVDDGSGTGTLDAGVTIDDLLYYLEIFNAGSPDADFDDGTGTGTLDGGVSIDDLLFYLGEFNMGC